MSAKELPETTAYVRVVKHSWQEGKIEGEISAASYEWRFQWRFRQGKLLVQPSKGRALILEPLNRFLERYDYLLESGGDYQFTIKAQF